MSFHVSHVTPEGGGSGLRLVCVRIYPDELTLCRRKVRANAASDAFNWCKTCKQELELLTEALAEVQAEAQS